MREHNGNLDYTGIPVSTEALNNVLSKMRRQEKEKEKWRELEQQKFSKSLIVRWLHLMMLFPDYLQQKNLVRIESKHKDAAENPLNWIKLKLQKWLAPTEMLQQEPL